MRPHSVALVTAAAVAVGASAATAGSPPGDLGVGWKTDFSRHSVPLSEIRSGGPGKDGIPALDHPRFMPAQRIGFVAPKEPVIALAVHGDVRGYPLQILIWHEIVNDVVGGVPVVVTFCPLCNTAIAFDRRVRGETLDFGTTGDLRDSDLVMYDRQTESWWQQFGGDAIVGRYTGTRLRALPSQIVAWAAFRRAHPDAKVLTRETGYSRPYGENPYTGYDDVSSPPLFPTANSSDRRLPPKERVVFIEFARDAVVVPFSTLARRHVVTLRVGGHRLVVRWHAGVSSPLASAEIASGRDIGSASVTERGRLVPFEEPFWFAVAAFRPGISIIRH